jgi:2-octaprenylphenol hydroxylase
MQVWNESGLIRFDAVDTGETHLGHIVENSVVVAGLLEQAARDTAVEVLVPAQVEAIETADARVRVVTAEHGTLGAALLLGADGAHSQVQDRPYGQRAIVATVRTELAHRESAWQRFLATGPLAFLPLADGRCSIVWSCDDDSARAILDYADEQFCEALSRAFERRLGEVTETSVRRAFPLVQRHAQTYLGRRTALLGDAAHVTHVLAGLGANLGFLDAAALAEIVADAAARGQDIGAHRVLRRYERWRRSENALVLSIMAGFKSVFGHRATWLRRLGGESLSAADWAAPAKRALMRRAMGLSGDLPQSARRGAYLASV